jgi:protoporphyrin/coproporphyrin ferrochelatase
VRFFTKTYSNLHFLQKTALANISFTNIFIQYCKEIIMESLNNLAHENNQPVGILLSNIGSPAAPTPKAVRKFLSEFLSDPRIIDWPRWLWLPVLYGIILVVRPKRSARLYQNIWDDGSPLVKILSEQVKRLATLIDDRGEKNFIFSFGMRYGSPSVAHGLRELRTKGAEKILVFPMFPQYSSTTTASIHDAVFSELKAWSWIPEVHLANNYHNNSSYISALSNSVSESMEKFGKPEKLMFSFHGVPKRYIEDTDDPYKDQCEETAKLVVDNLGLNDSEWSLTFQSKFGPEEWLLPATDATLEKWGKDGVESVHVICPGFSADCLETIDEIDREARESFMEAGGKKFHYIPALNMRTDHLDALANAILSNVGPWIEKENDTQKLNQLYKVASL